MNTLSLPASLPPSLHRPWQWQLGAIAVFLGWVDLIIFFSKLPLTGIYVVMFIDILYTFCRLFILSTLLVVAFGLAFFMAFNEPDRLVSILHIIIHIKNYTYLTATKVNKCILI